MHFFTSRWRAENFQHFTIRENVIFIEENTTQVWEKIQFLGKIQILQKENFSEEKGILKIPILR